MKKLFSLVLVLCLALSCIAFTASAEQTELEDVTLKVWIGGSGKQKDSDAVWALFNEQLKDYLPNTTVEFTAVTFDEYAEKWSKAMAAGEVIDAAWFGWMMNINTEIAMGSVIPLDDLIAAYGQDIVASLGQAGMDVHIIEGKTYAIPCWQGLAGSDEIELALKGDAVDAMENGQLYIEELEAVLQTVLKTESVTDRINMFYDKVEEFLISAVDTDTLGIGYNPRCSSSVVTLENGVGFGDCYTIKGDATFTVQSDVFSDSDAFNAIVLEMARKNDFFKKGYIRSDFLTCDPGNITSGSDPKSSWVMQNQGGKPQYSKWYLGAEAANHYHSTRIGQPYYLASGGVTIVMDNGYATSNVIPYTAKNPERAMMYINLMNSPKGAELYKTLTYGIEGQHWDMNEDGSMNVYMGEGQADSSWDYGQPEWAMGTMLNSVHTPSEDPNQWVVMQEFERTAVVKPLYNFQFDQTAVEIECVNCEAIMGEYPLGSLFCYDDFEDRLRERNDKMMAAGYELIYNELTAQINAYIEANGITGWPEY